MELPTYLQIEPVGQCNLRCQMCPIPFRQDGPPYGPPAFMDFAVFTKIIDDYTGLQDLHLQGLGEPMMHPRFFDMVRYAVDKGIRVTTNTNMTLLNARRAELCVSSGLDCVHASLDGASATTFEQIRLRGKFEKVMGNLELLTEARTRLRSSTPRLRLVAVIMKQNLHELPDLVRLAHRRSAESLFVQQLCHDFGESSLPSHYRPMRDFVDKESLLNEDLGRVEEYFGEARKVAAELNIELRLPRARPVTHPPGTPGRDRCSWPWTGGYISYQGLAMPCCMVATPDRINFGSVVEDGVSAVWNNRQYQEFREELASDAPPEICRSCSIYLRTF
jgi:radical SAM protein with 4Fe4S-binding SPASM domain